ncbi:alpha-acetolactate decarboxylase [Acrasis kona]|uniref:Alpha-acetolactate decarboxylase n=1 Tax=Acrasis kona TaxID=1008807 RepID=A0AAW2YYW5_9EUKA
MLKWILLLLIVVAHCQQDMPTPTPMTNDTTLPPETSEAPTTEPPATPTPFVDRTKFIPLSVGYIPLVLWEAQPYNSTQFMVDIASGVEVVVSITDDLKVPSSRYVPYNFSVVAREYVPPSQEEYDYYGTDINIPSSGINRTVYFNFTSWDSRVGQVRITAFPRLRIFTADTRTKLHNTTLNLNSLVMAVIYIEYDSPPPYLDQIQDITMNYNDLYISAYDSSLFVRPYERYYSFMTLNVGSMMFQSLNISDEAQGYVYDYINYKVSMGNMSTSPYYDLLFFDIDTSLINFTKSRSAAFQLCTHDFSLSNILYAGFLCVDLSTKQSHSAVIPPLVFFTDLAYYLFQFVMTFLMVYYVIFAIRMIRKGKKFFFVTDSIRNPPFWQCIIPLVPNKTLTNFRLWDSIFLINLHFFTSAFTILSQFVPNKWPKTNNGNDTDAHIANRKVYIGVACAVVTINTIFLLSKLFRSYKRHKSVRLNASSIPKYDKIIRFVLACISSLMLLPVMVMYVWALFPATKRDNYRNYLWYVATGFFTIGLCFYLTSKRTYVYDKYKWFGLKSTIGLILFDYVIEASWIVFQTMNTFASIAVVVRFIQASIMNMLYNFTIAPTYGYLLSIMITVYKFSIDIETPYVTLKNAICKERSATPWERIVIARDRVPKIEMTTIHQNMRMRVDLSFPIPLTWTVFFRISKLMRLRRQTNRTILNACLLMFILFMFFIGTQSYDTDILKQLGGNTSLIAILAGTMLPLIPQLTSFIGSTDVTPADPVFQARLANALKNLERKEEYRNTIPFNFNVPNRFMPFKYTLVSCFKEDKSEKMDPKYDYDTETRMPIVVDDDTVPTLVSNHDAW